MTKWASGRSSGGTKQTSQNLGSGSNTPTLPSGSAPDLNLDREQAQRFSAAADAVPTAFVIVFGEENKLIVFGEDEELRSDDPVEQSAIEPQEARDGESPASQTIVPAIGEEDELRSNRLIEPSAIAHQQGPNGELPGSLAIVPTNIDAAKPVKTRVRQKRPSSGEPSEARSEAVSTRDIDASKLFDASWYGQCSRSPEPVSYEQYLKSGIFDGVAPSPLFDIEYYGALHPEIDFRKTNPLEHYLKTPQIHRKDPHPLFDRGFYIAASPPLPSGVDPLLHYLFESEGAARQPHALFDPIFYVSAYSDVLQSRQLPLRHFITLGCAQHRNPHPLFNVVWYLSQTKDAEAERSPLRHYLEKGATAGISPHPLFDPAWYLSQTSNSDAKLCPLKHYIERGSAEGISPHPLFDPGWYRRT